MRINNNFYLHLLREGSRNRENAFGIFPVWAARRTAIEIRFGLVALTIFSRKVTL